MKSILDDPRFNFENTKKHECFRPWLEELFWEKLKKFRGTACHFLEIGTYEGASAIFLAENILTHKNTAIHTIDINEFNTLDIARKNISQSKWTKIALEEECSGNLFQYQWNDYDFIYIDGDHYAPCILRDAINCFEPLKVDGMMAFDDYESPVSYKGMHPSVAIDAFLAVYRKHVQVIHRGYTLWIRKTSNLD